MKYRAEIDGLRAFAVIPVILFHAGFEIFSGGYVGVDVFFVISGYLITMILIEEFDNKRFSIVNFYERRARRILPALFCVMLVCIPFAWLWMLPSQLHDFSRSLIAVSLFVSNVLFWRESGYFEAAAEEKPLLHTWSLAVEEQYYVLFPIFLLLAWRFGKDRVFWMIVVFAAISLALSEWGWRNKPTANFYLALTRAWELLAGSLAAFIVYKRGVQANNSLALLGLAAIVFAIFVYDKSIPFPSVYALLPVVGTVLLVLFAETKTLAARLLSLKAFVAIGLISYSAYLWHQPLFAFARIKMVETPSPYLMGLLIVLSLLLAIVTWRYVEKPFRDKKIVAKKQLFSATVLMCSLLIGIGFVINQNNGFDYRLNEEQRHILSWEKYPRQKMYREGSCFLRPEQNYSEFSHECTNSPSDTLIWGDSHAAALASGWRLNQSVHQLTASGCPPLLEQEFSARPQCKLINDHVIRVLQSSKYKRVLLHANWIDYGKKIAGLSKTIDFIKSLGISQVIVVGGVPQYTPSLPRRILLERLPLDKIDYIQYRQATIIRTDEKIRLLTAQKNVGFIQPLSVLCDYNLCKATVKSKQGVAPVAWDYGHLTQAGAQFLSSKLLDKL